MSENIGYYGYLAFSDFKKSHSHHKKQNKKFTFTSFLKNIRNLLIEFGFSELLDSFIVRPFCMYIFPVLLGSFGLGVIVGKIAADIVFYIPTIIAYELRKKHIKD